jgi:hypothetical protein
LQHIRHYISFDLSNEQYFKKKHTQMISSLYCGVMKFWNTCLLVSEVGITG